MNNIYTKLMEMRNEFHKHKLKKTGYNSYSSYYYFELGDFLPYTQELLLKYKLATFINFTNDIATLTLLNTEKVDETIIFTSPMSEAKLKACHEVQNLGAVQTYIRRYLYVNLLEIVEHDGIDATSGKEDKKDSKKENASTNTNIPNQDSKPLETNTVDPKQILTQPQIKRLYALGTKIGLKEDIIKTMVFKKFNTEPKYLNKKQYDDVCNGFIAKAEAMEESK